MDNSMTASLIGEIAAKCTQKNLLLNSDALFLHGIVFKCDVSPAPGAGSSAV